MWIETTPLPGDFVKCEFANFTGMAAKIGILIGYHDGAFKIEFGDMIRFIPTQSTFFVYQK